MPIARRISRCRGRWRLRRHLLRDNRAKNWLPGFDRQRRGAWHMWDNWIAEQFLRQIVLTWVGRRHGHTLDGLIGVDDLDATPIGQSRPPDERHSPASLGNPATSTARWWHPKATPDGYARSRLRRKRPARAPAAACVRDHTVDSSSTMRACNRSISACRSIRLVLVQHGTFLSFTFFFRPAGRKKNVKRIQNPWFAYALFKTCCSIAWHASASAMLWYTRVRTTRRN